MKTFSFFKKSIFLLALSLTCFTTLWAQTTITLTNGQVYSQNINMTANTTITIASGTATITGIISGASNYTLSKFGGGKIILTGINTYSGNTLIYEGTLQLGNGTTGSINSTSGVSLATTSTTLRFEPLASGYTVSYPISGQGNVEYKGLNYNSEFYLGVKNYTGTTTIELGVFHIEAPIASTHIIANGELYILSNNNTYSGIISGSGNMRIYGKLTLTGTNTFSGSISVMEYGTLQIGNGTSGSINNTSDVSLLWTSSTLRFEPGASMIFSKVIYGEGKVEYKGSTSKKLLFTGENSYTGTTTIEAASDFYIGNNGTTGKVAGNIIVNGGYLTFARTNEYTYTGVISGAGLVRQVGPGKTILTGVNTYSGDTYVTGTLQIGNGTSGSIANTSNVVIDNPAGTLRFEPGSNMTFSKVISGQGKVEYKGAGKSLTFTGENTYTGTTTIETGSNLYIGGYGTTGKITGNVINNGSLIFNRSNASTYDGVISGTGLVGLQGTGSITLGGVNTYTGMTYLDGGTIALSSTGTIAQSSGLYIFEGTFDITQGSKTIKSFSDESDGVGAIINLGNSTLTIGTQGQNNGGGYFLGTFTGTGGSVTKNGSDVLWLHNSNPNTATGTFNLNEGTVDLWANWAGNFNVAAGTTLEVNKEIAIGGTLNFLGSNIYMNLTTSPPSKLTISGAASAVGTNTLHITSGAVTNQILMQAASGLNNAGAFTLDMPGFDAELTATGTLLLLTATVTDLTPPVPGTGINGTAGETTAALTWTAATDNATPADNLRYYVYQSSSNNITTVANCEANGTLLNAGGTNNITSFTATGLNPETTYYFNVVVSDMASNKAAYTPKSITTVYAPNVQNVEIAPKTATLQPDETQQFTVTVTAVGGASENVTWSVSGNLSTLTTVNASGLLTIGTNETAETIMVRVTSVFNSAIFDDATVTVGEVGVKELQVTSNDVLVYPNPTTGMLTITRGHAPLSSYELQVTGIEIFDIYGRNVTPHTSHLSPQTSLDISDLVAGIYIVKITANGNVYSQKIVKN